MAMLSKNITNLVESTVTGLGYEFVGVEMVSQRHSKLLRIYIDGINGVLIDDCVIVSNQLSGALDVEDPILDNYQLEISSPGADRPFFKISQFEQFIGSTVVINVFKPINKQRKIIGQIEKTEGSIVFLRQDDLSIEIPLQGMSKARLVPDYSIKKGGRSGK
jgi:ribosome maturation factor RimP